MMMSDLQRHMSVYDDTGKPITFPQLIFIGDVFMICFICVYVFYLGRVKGFL